MRTNGACCGLQVVNEIIETRNVRSHTRPIAMAALIECETRNAALAERSRNGFIPTCVLRQAVNDDQGCFGRTRGKRKARKACIEELRHAPVCRNRSAIASGRSKRRRQGMRTYEARRNGATPTSTALW